MDEVRTVKRDKRQFKAIILFTTPIVIMAVVALALVLSWVYAPTDVLTIKKTPVPTHVVKDSESSGIVLLDIDYCKNLDVTGKVRISFVSSSREILLPESDDKAKPTCKQTEIPIVIPKDLPPDTYSITFRVTYDINPMQQNILEEFSTKPFKVE